MRIGHGYDVHRLTAGRALILGGVNIPHALGLDGHSDADVLTHAVMDAVLGALGEGDIGRHFPDNDDEFHNISSMLLAQRVAATLRGHSMRIVNIDATVIAQSPKLAPYIPQMRDNLAAAFGTEPHNINIKATTEERLGFTGSGEGIAAHAVCLIDGGD